MKCRKLIPVILLFCLPCFGQTNSADSTKASIQSKITDPNEIIMKYEEFLREETKLHREYTQEYYAMLLQALGALGVIVGGVLTWLNWKSKEEIRKQVNVQFAGTVQGLVNEQLEHLSNLIRDGKEKSEKQLAEINKLILELSAKSDKIAAQRRTGMKEEESSDATKMKGRTILWVDDFPQNNEYPRRMLEQAGVRFTLALDKDEALKILRQPNQPKFDLIISDMGQGTHYSAGLDFLKELNQHTLNIPVIIYAAPQAIAAYGDAALKLGAKAVTAGMTNVLSIVQEVLTAN